jgi:hypothetical protein
VILFGMAKVRIAGIVDTYIEIHALLLANRLREEVASHGPGMKEGEWSF